MRYLLLLFLAGCASSAPRQYAQGIPTAPRPPAFNPAWDAPHTTGQPGYVGPAENIPRSPHKRVLPPANEPGLWAGDELRASGDYWKTMDPVAWWVRIPFLDEPLDPFQTTVHQQTVRRCAFIIGFVGIEPITHVNLRSVTAEERACFVAKMFKHCADSDRTHVERFETYGPPLTDAFRDALRRTRALAKAFEWNMCKDGDTDVVEEAVKKAKSAWDTFSGRVNAVH